MKNEKSCGAIIFNNNKVLIIEQKTGFFGFPKGHVEGLETEQETAIREVKEETNLDIIVDEKLRFSISYIIKENVIKEVVYFVSKVINPNEIKIQMEELNNAFFVNIDEVNDILTFDNMKDVWNDILKEINIVKE